MVEEKFNDSAKQKAIEKYGDEVVNIDLHFENLTTVDRTIIFDYLLKNRNYFQNFKFKEFETKANYLMTIIKNSSIKPACLDIHVATGTTENVVPVYNTFTYHTLYHSPFFFPYLKRSNTFYIKGNYANKNSRFEKKGRIIKENELSISGEYCHNSNKFSLVFSNLIFLNIKSHDLELNSKLKYSKALRDIKRKESGKVLKFSLEKNFIERPFIFREFINYDRISKLKLQYAHKIINNNIDLDNCSPELRAHVPISDSQHHFKLSYLYNIANISEKNVSYFKSAVSLINSLNSNFLRSKLFYRKLFFFDQIIYQLNFEAGNVLKLNSSKKELKIHERIHINSFRGIYNPSPKTIAEEGKTGDSFGNTNYLMISNKILFNNILLNKLNLEENDIQFYPFIHFNILLIPDRKKAETALEGKTQSKPFNPLHLSAGFGVSVLTKAFAGEVYYNAYIKKNHHDIAQEFSINFGIE